MPASSVVLPVLIGLGLLFVVLAVVLWVRGHRGRALRSLAAALALVGLYLIGLLELVWNAALAIGRWASQLILNPTVWTGVALLGLSVVGWIVGGYLINRRAYRRGAERAVRPDDRPGVSAARPASGGTRASKPPVDDDMSEIEALLKSRGID